MLTQAEQMTEQMTKQMKEMAEYLRNCAEALEQPSVDGWTIAIIRTVLAKCQQDCKQLEGKLPKPS